MKPRKIILEFLRNAEARLEDAEDALTSGLYGYAFRLAQECVELALKACLKLVDVEYPRKHDVSPVLEKVADRFPEWFRKEVPRLSMFSQRLTSKRELSMYGLEDEDLGPESAISSREAEEAITMAKETLQLCKKLVKQYSRVKK